VVKIDLNDIRGHYFESDIEVRERVISSIVTTLIVYSNQSGTNIWNILDDLVIFQREAEQAEDYEVAEVFRLSIRVIKNLLAELEDGAES
jgi:hypothetical protein